MPRHGAPSDDMKDLITMLTPGGIFVRNPRLVFTDPPEGGGGGKTGENEPKPLNEHGFPDETPVAEMTTEQGLAYWRHHAKKHEKNRKPDNFSEIAANAQKWEQAQQENLQPNEKALLDAKNAGKQEGRSELLLDAVRGELRAQRPNLSVEDADELLADLNLANFVGDDGRVNVDKITSLASRLSPGDQNTSQQKQPQQTLADAVKHNGNPGASGGGGGSITAQREARRNQLTPSKK